MRAGLGFVWGSFRLGKGLTCRMTAQLLTTVESQSKPGTKMVYPEPCTGLRRRPQLFVAGAPY